MLKLIKRGPHSFHPEKPSAVGSRNSLNRGDRNEYEESRAMIDEEVDKLLNHVSSKLPPEVLEKMDIQGNIKHKLHNYYNQGMQNMLNRYITTAEDELSKKYRDLIDREESRSIARYSPRTMSDLIEAIAGADKFNTAEIEQSIVNIYGHLQGALQRGVNDVENHTNSLLRQKSDVGALVRGENAYSLVKCSFRSSPIKPVNVFESILSINILESEIVSPIYHLQSPLQELLKKIVSEKAHELIEDEVGKINRDLIEQSEPQLASSERIFERIKQLDNYFSDDAESHDSARYSIVAKKVIDCLEGIGSDIPLGEKDALNFRDNVKRIIDNENIKNRGFNTLVNNLTQILDSSKLGYQTIENFKNRRSCAIREYFTTDRKELPDENYSIVISYNDMEQIVEMRKAHKLQYNEILKVVEEAEVLIHKLFTKVKKSLGFNSYEDLEKMHLGNSPRDENGKFGEDKLWNELMFVRPKSTGVEADSDTFLYESELIKKKISRMKKHVQLIFKKRFNEERKIIENRLADLENKFNLFASKVNPFHVHPGVLLTIEVTSIRKKSTTMYTMANVLNEFLNMTSTGFADKAFAEFSRRRSTSKSNIEGEFISVVPKADNRVNVEEGALAGS